MKIFLKILPVIFYAFFSISFSIIIIPLSILSNFFKFFNSRQYSNFLIAGVETSNNIRQISYLLAKDKKNKVNVIEFIQNNFYCSVYYSKVVNVNCFFTENLDDQFFVKQAKRYFRSLYLLFALFEYDIIIFNWSDSFLFANIDYLLIRLAGIKLIVRHCGDDVRYRPLQHGIHKYYNIQQWDSSSRSLVYMLIKLYRQVVAENFALVLSSRDFATFQKSSLFIRPYIQRALPRSNGLLVDKPLLLHAPSDPSIKGTDCVVRAIEILRCKRDDFNFLLLTGRPHTEVLDALRRTAILIDQPGAYPARLATEGFASGCVVIGGNVEDIHGVKNCPSIQFPLDALKLSEIIENLLDNKTKMQDLSELSFEFWQDYCSEESFARFFEELIDGTAVTFSPLPNHVKLISSEAMCWYEKIAIRFRYGNLT